MSNNNELTNIQNNKIELKYIKILDIEKVDDFLFIILDNGQRILTNGNELYDVSDYNHISNLFNMGDKFCAVMKKGYSTYVINLRTMEILFEDKKVYHVSKQDDRTLHIIKIGSKSNNIYDIETQKYLPSPENYEFENSLGNNLYVFREKHNSSDDFYDYKRCIINADGKIILKDINGWIELFDTFIIIKKRTGLCIVKINDDLTLNINTIEQNEEIIAKPEYHDGNIIIIEKGVIKVFTPNFDLINKFQISGLESVIDYEVVANTLKLCIPFSLKGEEISKHLFINLKTGKIILHTRIECYPYSLPKTYVGKDNLNNEDINNFQYDKTYEQTEYYFYDSNFNKIIVISGNFYSEIDDNIFIVGTWNGKNFKRKYINTKTGIIKDSDYDIIQFSPDNPYGYAFNTATDMIDIVDKDLSVIIPNIDYKQLGLAKSNYLLDSFNYFVVNNYVCIIKHITDGPRSFYRYIIQNANGDIVLDSMEHKCFAMGNLIQIIKDGQSKFLNTLTGEIGQLSITAPTNEDGKIDFNKMSNFKNIFKIEGTEKLLLPSTNEQSQKTKKLIPNNKTDH